MLFQNTVKLERMRKKREEDFCMETRWISLFPLSTLSYHCKEIHVALANWGNSSISFNKCDKYYMCLASMWLVLHKHSKSREDGVLMLHGGFYKENQVNKKQNSVLLFRLRILCLYFLLLCGLLYFFQNMQFMNCSLIRLQIIFVLQNECYSLNWTIQSVSLRTDCDAVVQTHSCLC